MPTFGNQIFRRRILSYACAACLCGAGSALAAPGDPLLRWGTEAATFAEPAVVDALNALVASRAGESSGSLSAKVRDRASDMVLTAMNFLGVDYVRGGNSAESGFDCSGFTRFIFERSIGLMLPRRADEQAAASGMVAIRRDDLRPGDLVFFNTLRRTFSHVGIYVGDGKFIHSPRPGGQVRIENMHLGYWAARFTGARRAELPGMIDPQATAAH